MDSLSFAVDIFNTIILVAEMGLTILAFFGLSKVTKECIPLFQKTFSILLSLLVFIILYQFVFVHILISMLSKVSILYIGLQNIKFYALSFLNVIVLNFIIYKHLYSVKFKKLFAVSPNISMKQKIKSLTTTYCSSFLKISPVIIS